MPTPNTIEHFEQSVIDYIDRGVPIMVDWGDWAGHWQVIIIDTCGSDTPYDDVLIFADPYDLTDHSQDEYYIFQPSRFFGMWRHIPKKTVRRGQAHENDSDRNKKAGQLRY